MKQTMFMNMLPLKCGNREMSRLILPLKSAEVFKALPKGAKPLIIKIKKNTYF